MKKESRCICCMCVCVCVCGVYIISRERWIISWCQTMLYNYVQRQKNSNLLKRWYLTKKNCGNVNVLLTTTTTKQQHQQHQQHQQQQLMQKNLRSAKKTLLREITTKQQLHFQLKLCGCCCCCCFAVVVLLLLRHF